MTNVHPTIRKATAEDAKACAEIMQTWLDETPWIPDLHTLEETVNFCKNKLIGTYETWVLGDPAVGFLTLEPDNHVAALYVSPTGTGTGSKLLEHAKTLRPDLNLWVFQANLDAVRFYKRHGFEETARTDGEDNQEKLPDIKMNWQSNT